MSKAVPYASATSGAAARDEILRLLRRFGCQSVGFMDDFQTHTLTLQFSYRDRNVILSASAQGWANYYLREHPWTSRRQGDERDYKQKWLQQGMVAINSILRDWVKGQLTAIETGILTFDHIFLPYMLTPSGETVAELAFAPQSKLLAAPAERIDYKGGGA